MKTMHPVTLRNMTAEELRLEIYLNGSAHTPDDVILDVVKSTDQLELDLAYAEDEASDLESQLENQREKYEDLQCKNVELSERLDEIVNVARGIEVRPANRSAA